MGVTITGTIKPTGFIKHIGPPPSGPFEWANGALATPEGLWALTNNNLTADSTPTAPSSATITTNRFLSNGKWAWEMQSSANSADGGIITPDNLPLTYGTSIGSQSSAEAELSVRFGSTGAIEHRFIGSGDLTSTGVSRSSNRHMFLLDLDSPTPTLQIKFAGSIVGSLDLPAGHNWYIATSISFGQLMTLFREETSFVNSVPAGYSALENA